ncbi:hypothetical protein [Sagittula sp. SSi028]|uniref:hypothetical protein n=1 Tax=Sagittula sp. SSi028 TaxID=3400636 RepID=UPI003AF6580E
MTIKHQQALTKGGTEIDYVGLKKFGIFPASCPCSKKLRKASPCPAAPMAPFVSGRVIRWSSS